MTGIEPVTTCLGNKHSVHLSYILIGGLDGSCTRFFLAENQNDFSVRPQGYTGMMGFEPTIFRSTGDCFEPLSYTPKVAIQFSRFKFADESAGIRESNAVPENRFSEVGGVLARTE